MGECGQLICSMSDIKLSYFNARGRAETARLILAHAGVRYIDQRLTTEQFASVKSRLPYGQLPTLKYDGEVVCTSLAIARFLANQYGLAGDTNLEAAQADEIVDWVNDIVNKSSKARFETNEEKKIELMKELISELIPSTLGRLESRLKERGGQFFAGNKLTWADLHVFAFFDKLRLDNAELLEDFPTVQDLIERVEEMPNISRWLKSRPTSLM